MCGFYPTDEVTQARLLLAKFVSKKRVRKPKGSDKEVATRSVSIMLKLLLLDPQVTIPAFCAMNIARLPPVDVNHVDVCAVLHELSVLRNEVRAVSELKEEMAQLRRIISVQNRGDYWTPLCSEEMKVCNVLYKAFGGL